MTWETVPADAYATAGTTAEVKGTTAAGTYDNIKVAAGQVVTEQFQVLLFLQQLQKVLFQYLLYLHYLHLCHSPLLYY